MAVPHVVGTALHLRNAFPWASNKQIMSCIAKGSSKDKVLPPSAHSNGDQSATVGTGVLSAVASYDCLTAAAGRAPNTAYVTCNPAVTVQLKPGSCSSTSYTPPARGNGGGLYTVYGRAGSGFRVTTSPAGRYPLGSTALVTVTLDDKAGMVRSCTSAVTVLPCPIKCKAVTISATLANNCQASDAVLAASAFLDKSSLDPAAALSFSPPGPYPIGTVSVTVTASYPGIANQQQSATCAVTVAPVGGLRSWVLSSKPLCLYRKVESTQEYCLPASQLVSVGLSGATGCYTAPRVKAASCAGATAINSFNAATPSSPSSSAATAAATNMASTSSSSMGFATAAVPGSSIASQLAATCRVPPATAGTSAAATAGEAQVCVKFNAGLSMQRVQVRVDVTDGRSTRAATSSITMWNPSSAALPPGAPSSCVGV